MARKKKVLGLLGWDVVVVKTEEVIGTGSGDDMQVIFVNVYYIL